MAGSNLFLRKAISYGLRHNLKVLSSQRISQLHDEKAVDTVRLIQFHGYDSEVHKVETQDGYILTLHRIVKPLEPSVQELSLPKPPVLLQHGLWSSSSDWVVPDPPNNLGCLLVDHGYDVWLGNSRGNPYSRSHSIYDPLIDPDMFWNFSWHEMGLYDLPAAIDYVLSTTGTPHLRYIGHSQGTTSFFVLMSTRPDYNNKVSFMFGLAPVAYLSNIRSKLVRTLAPHNKVILNLTKVMGQYKVLPNKQLLSYVKELCTRAPGLIEAIVFPVFRSLSAYACDAAVENIMSVALAHMSAGASLKQLAHFGQCCDQGQFQQFDYGPTENMQVYGQPKPPAYNLSNITVPIRLYYSDHDWLAQPQDVLRLYESLSNRMGIIKVGLRQFNHLDFIWGMQTSSGIFDDIKSVLETPLEILDQP